MTREQVKHVRDRSRLVPVGSFSVTLKLQIPGCRDTSCQKNVLRAGAVPIVHADGCLGKSNA